MHNIHDIKSICSQNVFIYNVMLNGVFEIQILSYKPTPKWQMSSCAIIGKRLILAPLVSLIVFSCKHIKPMKITLILI
jgi:hypothetical protein